MKPAPEQGPAARDEQQEVPVNLANSFNISDGLAKRAHETSSEAQPRADDTEGADSESCGTRKRSPSPSAVSTASSGSPLIRSDSSTSSASSMSSGSGGPTRATSLSAQKKYQQHSSNQQQQQLPSGPLKRPPAPTSIAAAQLQQQQGLHAPAHQHQADSPSSNRSQKYPNGNKLAHMAKFQAKSQQQEKALSSETGQQHERDRPKKRKSAAHQCGGPAEEMNGKSFGYNLGKTLAFRASRFSEFWSVNKMRYMNLACLLMTLVCLVTILLFSKTSLISSNNSVPAEIGARLAGGHQQHQAAILLAERQLRHRNRILQDDRDQDGRHDDDGEQPEAPVESIHSMDRQAFVRGRPGDERDEATSHDDSSSSSSNTNGTPRLPSSDGFNLFDERHDDSNGDGSSSSKRSLDEMILDARRQLKRQQEEEQEQDQRESANLNNKSSSQQDTSGQPESTSSDAGNQRPSSLPLANPISQVLQDLDGFGLFKSIKSRLIDQLEKQNLSSRGPTIMRSKNGATIIMSFSAPSDNASEKQNTTTGSGNNSTTLSSSPSELASEALPSFLRDLLPPMLTRGSGMDRRPSGFAAITINSEPTLSIRSSGLPFGGAGFESAFGGLPFMGPSPFSFALPSNPSSMSSATPNQRPPLIMAGGGGGGLMSMLLRASNEIANQMRQQLEQANNNQTSAAQNGTINNKQEANQQVKVIQLFGGPPPEQTATNSSATNSSSSSSATTNGDEQPLDAFGFGRLVSAPSTTRQATTIRLPLSSSSSSSSPFESIFSTRRSAGPIGGSIVMIESSSSGLPSIMSSSDSPGGSPLASVFGPPNPAFMSPFESDGMLQAMPKPFPILPNVFLLGAGGHQRGVHHRTSGGGAHFPMPVNPILRSILNNVMSDLSQSALESDERPTAPANRNGAGKPAQPEVATKPGSGSSNSLGRRDDNPDDSEWDEFVPSHEPIRAKSRTRSRAVDQPDFLGDSSDEPQASASQESGPFRFPATTTNTGGSSMFEQMFEHLNGGAAPARPQNHHQHHSFGGTIRQTIRGPNGLTVERVIGLGPATGGPKQRHYIHKGSFQTVAPGVRSQSLSRMDTPDNSNDNRLRSSSSSSPPSLFARLFGADGLGPESPSQPHRFPAPHSMGAPPMNFISDLLGHELASDQNDDEPSASKRGFRATIRSLRPVRAELIDRSSDGTELDDDTDTEPANMNVNVFPPRVTSARIRLVRPADSSGPPMLAHFRLMANLNPHQQQQSVAPTDELGEPTNMAQQARAKPLPAASPFTSPSSPLFGFPVMKAPGQMSSAAAAAAPPSTSSPQQETGGSAELEREQADNDDTPTSSSAAASGSHRRQRSFVYHSNHEIAQNQARPRVAQPTSSQQHQQQLDAARHSHGLGSQPTEPRSATSANHQSHHNHQHQPQQQQQQQAAAAPLPPAASVVMGRRLDDFVERRK